MTDDVTTPSVAEELLDAELEGVVGGKVGAYSVERPDGSSTTEMWRGLRFRPSGFPW